MFGRVKGQYTTLMPLEKKYESICSPPASRADYVPALVTEAVYKKNTQLKTSCIPLRNWQSSIPYKYLVEKKKNLKNKNCKFAFACWKQ